MKDLRDLKDFDDARLIDRVRAQRGKRQRFQQFYLKARSKFGLDCPMCAMFARQQLHHTPGMPASTFKVTPVILHGVVSPELQNNAHTVTHSPRLLTGARIHLSKSAQKSLCKSQFPHKFVNGSLINTNIKNELTDSCGN